MSEITGKISRGSVIWKSVLWARSALFILGCATLLYCATMIIDAKYYQAVTREQLRSARPELPVVAPPSNLASSSSPAPPTAGLVFSFLGRIDIPRAGISAMIGEGASSRVLRVAVGHVPGTALPWEPGNVVLAAHRDSFFQHLAEVKTGDIIQITVPGSGYSYRVSFTDVIDPKETWVLQPATGETLTLITCYPFHFIGAAPKRFVVRARLLDSGVHS